MRRKAHAVFGRAGPEKRAKSNPGTALRRGPAQAAREVAPARRPALVITGRPGRVTKLPHG